MRNTADLSAAERFRLTLLTPGAFLRCLEEQTKWPTMH
jgi:hypothetical protein